MEDSMAGRRIRRALARTIVAALALATPAVLAAPSASAVSPNLLISQVYGGGGNTGAPYTNDFVELFNRGTSAVSLSEMSIQYTSGAGTGLFGANDTQLTELPNVILQPGQYYLVQQGGGANGVALPTPDLVDATPIAMSATAGRVALVDGTTSLGCNGGTTPCSAGQLTRIIDLVGYGTASFFEGSGPTPAPSNTTAVLRAGAGCTDTDNNATDFTAGAPAPRTTATAVNVCGVVTPDEPVINEFSASTVGTDVEYIEIYGSPATDYSGYSVLQIEGDLGGTGVVDSVHAIGSTGANGLYLANLAANALENGTLTLLLVKDFTGAVGDDLDANDDGTLDVTPWSAVADSVAVTDGATGDLTYGVPVLAPSFDGGAFTVGGASRIPDGTDTDTAADWVRNDFDLAGIPGFTGTPVEGEALNTPGAPNALVEVEPPPPTIAKIHEIQGAGSASPVLGQNVVAEGIVTSLFTSNDAPDGFFLQEEETDWDNDPATSEGLFVFCRGQCPAEGALSVGDTVQVRGTVTEFFGMTQLSSNVAGGAVDIVTSGDISALPPAVEVDLPADGSTRDAATFEAVEGMVVEFTDTLVVSEYFELARYGQLVLTVDERPYQFTHSNLPSVEGYAAFIEALDKSRIILDDDNNTQNDATSGPDDNEPYPWPQGGLSIDNRVRGGDTIDDLTGVMHWSFAGQSGTDAWRIRPIQGMDYEFTSANPAPDEPEDVGGRLKVTSYNVLNYFATVAAADICGPSGTLDCRGADSEIERQRQLTKIVAGLAEIDADVAGLIEIENDGDDESVHQIVDALNGLTAPGTYAAIETGFIGSDAIKVALVYQPATVTPVGDYAILDSSDDPRFVDTANRPVLIQTFEENSTGERFTIAVNHLKSKGSPCAGDPNLNDGQGNCNLTRTAAVEALMDHLATDPTNSGDPDFLIVGDLNAYAMEDPITTLEAAGWTDLHEEFEGPEGYSYVFDGQLGYLDTALANPSLLPQVTGATAWHINADEVPLFDYNDEFRTGDEQSFERESDALPLYSPDPLRSSDHDPVIVGLALGDPAEVVADLRETVAEMDLQRGVSNALDAKLRSALEHIAEDDPIGACDSLQSFIDQVSALTGKKITEEEAEILIEEAVIARVMLDC
jgi:uncharacterized protein